jgi:FkbM family methyltransferase
VKRFLERFLTRAGLGVTSLQNLANLRSAQEELYELKKSVFGEKIRDSFPIEDVNKALSQIRDSKAQLQQDLIALLLLDFKTNGYFVEFGATDGVKFSNSMLLESAFGWTGILAEPGKNWHKALKSNRNGIIETRCVWETSGEILEFNETESGELSTLEMFSSGDLHADHRISGVRYNVETISLQDLLELHNAPASIDYLSIDTEGSEFTILQGLDFEKFNFNFISCEHNFTESRELIRKLLVNRGYVRILEKASQFDDWYISKKLAKFKGFI